MTYPVDDQRVREMDGWEGGLDGCGVVDANSVMSPPDRHYECSKGHRWTTGHFEVNSGVLMVAGDETAFCVRCLLEVLKSKVGQVKEVV